MLVRKSLSMYLIIAVACCWSVAVDAQLSPFAEYRIGPSDVLTVSVWQQEELTRTVTVRSDGAITFPLLGDLPVAGLTPLELRDILATRLVEYINVMVSEVTVSVEELNSYYVSVMGEVRAPGRFQFQSRITVVDALAEAGGFTAFAATSKVLILRQENGVTRRIPFDYRGLSRGRRPPEPLVLIPGDIVMVP